MPRSTGRPARPYRSPAGRSACPAAAADHEEALHDQLQFRHFEPPHAADLTRRGFAMTSLAAGFALAVQPVSAETITTDTEGLRPAR